MARPQDIEGRTFQPTLLRGGLNLTDSKFDVFAGSLQDCLNYESTHQGYTRSQGLFMYDGTYNNAIEDMWYISTTTGVGGESVLTGTEFTLGGEVTWRVGTRKGIVVYWSNTAGPPDTTILGVVDIQPVPATGPYYSTGGGGGGPLGPGIDHGDVLVDTETGAELDLANVMAIDPGLLSDNAVADTIAEYLPYINDTINHALVSQVSPAGSLATHGEVPGQGPITGGFQFQDDVYAVRDYYSIGFINGGEELFSGDIVAIDRPGANPIVGTVGEISLVSGNWASSDAAGSISLTGEIPTEDWITATAYVWSTVVLHNGIMYGCRVGHTSSAATEPGIGASWETVWEEQNYDGMLEYLEGADVWRYQQVGGTTVAQTTIANEKHKGILWKGTIYGWERVDTGYSLDFLDGYNAPNVQSAPLFVDNMLAYTKNDGGKDWGTPTSVGGAPFSTPWTNPGNGTTSDNSRATCVLAATGDRSALLDATINTASVPNSDARVVGVKVEIEGQNAGAGTATLASIRLYNSNTDADWYLSEELAVNELLNAGVDATYTYGGATDMWGVGTISAQDILDGKIGVKIQCENTHATLVPTAAIDNVVVTVYYVPIAEHVYVYDGSSDVAECDITAWQITNGEYTWRPDGPAAEVLATGSVSLTSGASGSVDSIMIGGISMLSAPVPYNTSLSQTATDVAANITANTTTPNYTAAAVGAVITITASAGTGSSPNGLSVVSSCTTITSADIDMASGSYAITTLPAGVFTLYNIDNPTAIKAGMTIYTGAGGTGLQVATVKSTAQYNCLPSNAEMYDASSRYETIKANFYEDSGDDAVYGATGASNAFSYNGRFFSFIKTPILEAVDVPRHVAFHVNMLALGYETGHVLISSVGSPHDFSGVTGGTSWGFRDAITGLQELPGATLGVLSTSSTSTLTGYDPSSMTQKNVQPNSGAIEYTLQKNIEPYFLDFHGVSTLNTTQKFGDFNFGRIVDEINPWLEDRVQAVRTTDTVLRSPVGSISIRSKNQYRTYFADGWILTVTTFENRGPEATWQHYDTTNFSTDYVPTFLDSTVLSSGKERAIMGTADGYMWVIDGANLMQTRTRAAKLDAYITTNPINMGRPEAVSKYHHVILQGQFYGWQHIKGWADTNYTFDVTGAAQRTINIGSSSDATVVESSNNLDSVYLSMVADGYSIKLQTELDGSKPHTLQSLVFRASLKGTDRTRTTKAY